MKVVFRLFIIAAFPVLAAADDIYFKDGMALKGKIVKVDSEHVTLKTDDKNFLRDGAGRGYPLNTDENTIEINRADIRRIVYDDGTEVKVSGGSEGDESGSARSSLKDEEKIFDTAGNNIKCRLSAGINKMSGHTTYQIGGKIVTPQESGYVRFPISELEFPLDVYMYTIEGTVLVQENWKAGFRYSWNSRKNAGKMKDSDWGYFYYEIDWWTDQNSFDIYSESDADLKSGITEADISYMFMRIRGGNFTTLVYAGGGYIYQTFDFRLSNVDQWYPSLNNYYGYDVGHDRISGLTGTYKVTTKIPYFALSFEMNYKDVLSMEIAVGYSPFVKVNDEDHHLLREPPKVSKAKCDGDAKLFSIGGRYFFYKPVFAGINIDYLSVDTEGREKQWNGGEYFGTIEQKNFSKRINYGFAIGGELQI